MKELIEVGEAVEIVLANVRAMGEELVPLDMVAGRVLARDAAADCDIPPADVSSMDGFAVAAADVEMASRERPATLAVAETIAAGKQPREKVGGGRAARIMTGAVIPCGADAVVMMEDADAEGDELVKIFGPVRDGKRNIRRAGGDAKKGEVVAAAGKILRPFDIGALAMAGFSTAPVVKKPLIGVLTTGDELVPVEAALEVGKMRSSNGYAICAMCREAGADAVNLGIAPDSKEAIAEAVAKAVQNCDAIITTGGVSMGRFDMTRAAIESLGKILFWKINTRPGRSSTFGVVDGIPVFALPGGAGGSARGTELLAIPAIRKMLGVLQESKV